MERNYQDTTNTSQNLTQYQITSAYKDRLVITHHNTGNIQVQGRSLFCYEIFMDWHCKWRTNATVHEAKKTFEYLDKSEPSFNKTIRP